MHLEFERVVPAPVLDATWRLYNRALEELRRTAVQRHVMHRDEFDHVMADERVWKYRGVTSTGEISALATFTNDLDSMPLISPDYFAHHWPQLYKEHRIWYIGFFVIDPKHRRSGIFERVIAHMWQQVVHSRGIALLDIARRNEEVGLPDGIQRVLLSLSPGMQATRLDEQTYWLYEPPAGTTNGDQRATNSPADTGGLQR
jgi:hypothetical protein